MEGFSLGSTGRSRARTRFDQVVALASLLVLNAYLLAPVLLIDGGLLPGRDRGVDKVFLFSLPTSILWLIVGHLWVRRPWVLHAALAPFYLTAGIDLYSSWHYRSRLTSSLLLVIGENWANAGDFIHDRAFGLVAFVLVVLIAYPLGLLGIRRLEHRPHKIARGVALLALVGFYGIVALRQSRADGLRAGVMDTVLHDRSSPIGVLAQGYVAHGVYRDTRKFKDASAGFRFDARRFETPAESEVYVLVIGESSRPDHWGMYGYSRATTPLLSTKANVWVIRDAVSSAALTQIAVPAILTRRSIRDLRQHPNERSILSLMREVGFRTHWYSTQQRDFFTGAINRYAGEADEARFFDRERDAVLVEAVRASMAANPTGKHFFVLHSQGSHNVYQDRYPPQFERFQADKTAAERDRIRNAYDNTIAYTDFVLSELIDRLAQHDGISALMYLSDHGENLADDDRHLIGHFLNNEYDLPIPMFLWHSPAFCRKYPEKLRALSVNASLPVDTRIAFYTLADMVGATLDDPDLPRLSLFGDGFATRPREVFREWDSENQIVTANYDSLGFKHQ